MMMYIYWGSLSILKSVNSEQSEKGKLVMKNSVKNVTFVTFSRDRPLMRQLLLTDSKMSDMSDFNKNSTLQ
ncbi:hypothetical protein HMPREF9455_02791 [Dysgonomonas gadei ATCC BAA-286]|uniref:Uncharacterized protein n=1 Tax=Dysgonomonas gadei ATCC BAA-286 TaxID=742766 RepID=F5J0C4_9BACT|nr:hypothetical protein HMPREF9455_02791 [Dysgonomonas gadei ATCC BAA-286]